MSFKNHVFFVSRQCYWGMEPEDQNVVEVAQGGLEYSNPDMIVSQYDGEGEEYVGMVAAVTAAIKIAELWRKDKPELPIQVATGNTGGMTMPFEGQPDTDNLLREAKEFDEKLPHCPQCAEIGELTWHHELSEEKFCSENCCNLSLEWHQKEEAVFIIEEAMAENSWEDQDLIDSAYCGSLSSSDSQVYYDQPKDERSNWLIRRVLSWHDCGELLQEIEDTGK